MIKTIYKFKLHIAFKYVLGLSMHLTNFQHLVNDMLEAYQDNHVVRFLDNITMISKNQQEHQYHARISPNVYGKMDYMPMLWNAPSIGWTQESALYFIVILQVYEFYIYEMWKRGKTFLKLETYWLASMIAFKYYIF